MTKGVAGIGLKRMLSGRGRNAYLSAAVILSLAIGFGPAAFSVPARSAAAAREKRLGSSQAKAFVRGLKVEMSIVLYPIANLDGTKAERADFEKRFKARGSMARKTRSQIAAMFNEDVEAAFKDREISAQIVEAVNRYLESKLKPVPKS